MTGSGFGELSTAKLLVAAAIIAIVSGALVGLGVGYVIHYDAPTTRTFYLFDRSLPFNETVFKIPHDTWVPDTITVNKGDHVLIHFLDTEATPEGHTYTMDSPYTFNAVVYKNETQGGGIAGTFSNVSGVIMGQSQTATITFTASWAGTFRYYCAIHQPTMTGYLVVIG
ncbi:MAG TPA: plastocyanin/azurin family copper-binding protein [Candidatus Angelobacter sp.]|nr:plastocyanin/azurin family copper-binding protein [Candidatus Angelobacter sp.]